MVEGFVGAKHTLNLVPSHLICNVHHIHTPKGLVKCLDLLFQHDFPPLCLGLRFLHVPHDGSFKFFSRSDLLYPLLDGFHWESPYNVDMITFSNEFHLWQGNIIQEIISSTYAYSWKVLIVMYLCKGWEGEASLGTLKYTRGRKWDTVHWKCALCKGKRNRQTCVWSTRDNY